MNDPLIRIDARSHQAWLGGGLLLLTRMEFRLLHLLAAYAGSVVTREDITRDVWETDWLPNSKTIDMHMSWLRRKLGDDATSPRYIATVRGVGFRLEPSMLSPESSVEGFTPPPPVSGDALAVVREMLADMARIVGQSVERIAELERARDGQEVTPCG